MSDSKRRRLERLEHAVPDWASRLEYVDYLGIEEYPADEWTELHHEGQITVLKHIETGQIIGRYDERRGNAEIRQAGGYLAFL